MVVEGKVARFVELRARIELDLRRLMARLPAERIEAETRLRVEVRIDGEGESVLRGALELVTPRVLQIVSDVADGGLRFDEDLEALGSEAAPRVLVLAPEGDAVRYAPPGVALSAIDVVALDRGRLVAFSPCEEGQAPRQARSIELWLYDRRSGEKRGQKSWPAAVAPCDEGGEPVAGPSIPEIVKGVRWALEAQD
jgi:hypothetical protein